ncbi:MAG: hypothetical protein ACYSYT_03570, partial [Planctomycetota bacterium]
KEREDSIFDALDKDGNFNANGYGLAIWGNFLAPRMVRTSSTVRVRTFASFDAAKRKLFVYIINKSEGKEAVSLDVKGHGVESVVQRWEQVGKGPDDTEPVWRKGEILLEDPLELTVPGVSITVVEYRLK